jgi:hypothetical protein
LKAAQDGGRSDLGPLGREREKHREREREREGKRE